MNGVAKALVDFWTSHWWQLYSGALLAGIISTLGIGLCIRDEGWAKRSASVMRALLFLGLLSMATAIALTVAHRHESPWESLSFLYDHHLGFFVDGAVLTGLIVSLLRKPALFNAKTLETIWLDDRTLTATRLWVGVFYVACGINKFWTHETLDFFHSSGYSTPFFFFIATWELAWGLALLSRRTAILATGALSIDMFGAIFTHYHNYFTKGLPGPFENSLDALRMLVLLAYIAFPLMKRFLEARGTRARLRNVGG
jgi:hypothetical protein